MSGLEDKPLPPVEVRSVPDHTDPLVIVEPITCGQDLAGNALTKKRVTRVVIVKLGSLGFLLGRTYLPFVQTAQFTTKRSSNPPEWG